MLVLSRKVGEKIVIDGEIVLVVMEIGSNKVRLGIEAPRAVPIRRKEVYDAIHKPNTTGGPSGDSPVEPAAGDRPVG